MPAVLRSLELVNVGGGIVHFGDSAFKTPKLAEKTFGGSGAFNTGGFIVSNSISSSSIVIDPTLIDQPIAGNN